VKTQPLPQISGELALTSELKPPQASLPSETKRILYLLAACIALTMTGYGIVMPVFAKRIGELGSGVQALGLMTMSFAFAQFLLSPFMGSFADRFGRRPLILIALAGEVIANGAYLYAQSVPLYIAIRFFQGGISAGLLPAALWLLGIEFQKHNAHNGLASSGRVMRQASFLALHSEDCSLITGGMPLPLPSLESWHCLRWCLPW
jgi:MFS family permease